MIRAVCLASATSWHRRPVWSLVGNFMGEGSTVAKAACKYAGIDPDITVRDERKRLA